MFIARVGFNIKDQVQDVSSSAQRITRASKSNLAFAFLSLGKERRRDISVFYAFCRLIDDIADSSALAASEKKSRLEQWRGALRAPLPNESPIAAELRAIMQKYPITPAMLDEIIDGVEMDLTIARYPTFAALREYCYRVASAVGLVSIEIFGYRNPACKDYAIELGLALQITNILRDVAKDLESGRVYLPEEDMARFAYSAEDLAARTDDDRFVRLMQFEADRAHRHFENAAALLPPEDRRAMLSAEIMSAIYRALLRQMERDRFRVFERDYRIGKLRKLLLAAGQFLK